MAEENAGQVDGQVADASTSDTSPEQKSVEYFQGQKDKVEAEYSKYKLDTGDAVKGYAQLQDLYTKYDGSDGKTSFADHMKAYFQSPESKPPSDFDAAVDYDAQEAATNPESPSGKFLRSQIDERVKEMGITPDVIERLQSLEQEKIQDEQHTQYIGELMKQGFSPQQAIEFIDSVKTGGDKFLLGDLAKAYLGADSLQHVRDTQKEPPSVAAIQGAAPADTTPDDDAWNSILAQTGGYKEKFAP